MFVCFVELMCFRNEVFLNCEHLEPARKNIFAILVSPETIQKSLPTFWSKLFTIYFVPCLSLGDEVVVCCGDYRCVYIHVG